MSSRSLQSSAIWRLLEVIGGEATAFLVFAVLARLLVPEHFGAVALATSVILLCQVLVYHGALESLIQIPGFEPRHFQAATAANLVVGVALVVLVTLLAWPLGLVLEREEFAIILIAMLPILLVRAVTTPMLAVVRRQMDFKAVAVRTLVAVCSGGAVAIALAAEGAGVWALVAQQWTNELVGMLMLAWRSPHKPWQLRWDRAALDDLRPVALPVTGANLASAVARRLDIFAIGLRLGDTSVGIYFMVSRLVFAMQMLTQYGLGEVAMVVMCKLRPAIERPWTEISAVLRLAAWPTFMLFGLMAIIGPSLVPLVFGAAWEPATMPMALYAAFSPAGAIVGLIGVALVSAGNAEGFQRLSIVVAFVQLVAIFVAAAWGLMAVVAAIGVVQVLSVPYALSHLRRTEQIGWSTLLRRLGPIVVVYLACFVPSALVVLQHPEMDWLVGKVFLAVGAVLGVLLLRRDWKTVTAALAQARPPG